MDFAYDLFARRVQKRVTRAGISGRERLPVSVTRFVWDGDVLVHEITTRARAGGDPVVEERTYCFEDEGFEPVAHRDDVGQERGGWFHYVNDSIGAPERLIGADGEVACELRRRAWGTEVLPGGKAHTPLRLQGQYADEETGLIYNRWRYLSAEGDVFCSPDPLGLMAGMHSYRAVWSSFSWMDPFGLATMREAEALLNASEGRQFGNNVGHASVHVPPVGGDPVDHVASRGNANDTGFRSRNQAIRALRDCMTQNEAQLNALTPGQTHGTPHGNPALLSQSVEGLHAKKVPYGIQISHVSVNAVSYNFGKRPAASFICYTFSHMVANEAQVLSRDQGGGLCLCAEVSS